MMFGFKKKAFYKVINKNTGNIYQKKRKSLFKEGDIIRITFPIATDESYSLKIDGENVSIKFCDEGGLLEFVMPNHDVYYEINSKNDMEYIQKD